MRICLVSQEYPPETADGGIGYQTHAKAHGLARRGHEVHVISVSPDHQQHDFRRGGPDAQVLVMKISMHQGQGHAFTEFFDLPPAGLQKIALAENRFENRGFFALQGRVLETLPDPLTARSQARFGAATLT